MGVISFLPIQPGEGEPSPVNIRPIYAPLNIDGIGEVWGGEINTNAATITSEWHGINLNGVDYKVNHSYMTDEVIAAGIVCLPRFTSTNGIPALIRKRLDYIWASNMECGSRVHNSSPIWTIPGAGRIYVTLWFGPRDGHPEVTTDNECIAFVNNWLKENPVQFVYLLPTEQHVTYNLTTAQLHQALNQLKTYLGGELPLTQMPEIRRRILLNEPHLVTPAPVALHTFSTNMVAPLKECKIHFEPVQEGEGDPSPDNVRAITGWTGIELTRCGKNLFNLADFAKAYWTEVPDAEYPDTYTGRKWRLVQLYGIITDDPKSTGLLPKRLPLGRVALSWYDYNTSNWRVYFHYDGETYWDNHSGNINSVGLKKSVSIASKNCDGVALYTTQGQTANGQIGMVQVEVGSEFTDYEPFNGVILPIDWSSIGEIPGGYVDLVRGKLVVDLLFLILDNTNEWVQFNNESKFYVNNVTSNAMLSRTDYLSNLYPFAGNGDTQSPNIQGDGYFYGQLSYKRIWVSDSRYETVDDLKAALAVNPLKIVYPISNPIEYSIDPVTLKPLRGLNNIWSNANGNIDLAYWTH